MTASAVTDPVTGFGKYLAGIPDENQRKRAISKAKLLGAQEAPEEALEGWKPQPLEVDYDAAPDAPDWIVHGLIERGTVVLLSADTGAAKSIVAKSLTVAAVHDVAWLDHETNAQRVLVVDEENPRRVVTSRLSAQGMTNAAQARLRYFNREGFALGDGGRSDERLREQLEDFRPDLVIVDTVMAACDLEDVNSNSEAVRLMKHLRALAREFDCTFLVLHHERKKFKEQPASSGQAMMGARQWAGQADAQMTLTVESDLIVDEIEDGRRFLRRTFKWRPAEKDRDGNPNVPQRVAVTSEKDEDGRLLWMLVENEGEIEQPDSETDALAVSIAALVRRAESEIGTAEIAKGVDKDPQTGTFKRALSAAYAADWIEKVKRGRWVAGVTEPGLVV